MSYLAPNTTVYLKKYFPLDYSYEHTMQFNSASDQYAKILAFNNSNNITLTNQSYQRVNKNTIRVDKTYEQLLGVNYMIFKNTNFENKWFYAFVTKIDYINNNCSELTYEIDVMQSWAFDYDIKTCFVEREHELVDTVGSNTLPENIPTGDLISISENQIDFSRYLGCIVSSSRLRASVFPYSSASEYYVLTRKIGEYEAFSGSSSCGFVYYGFPILPEDCSYFYSQWYSGSYDVQMPYGHNSSGSVDSNYKFTLGQFFQCLDNGGVYKYTSSGSTVVASLDDIIAVYVYPAELNNNTRITNASTFYGYESGQKGIAKGSATSYSYSYSRPSTFTDIQSGSSYTPRNNKLLTYPYIDIAISNHEGEIKSFKFEHFANTGYATFEWVGTYGINPLIMLYPRGYQKVSDFYDEGITISNFPTLQTTGSEYYNYIQRNTNKMSVSALTGVINSGFKTISGNVDTSGATQIFNTIATLEDLNSVPAQIAGEVSNDLLLTGTKRCGYTVYTRCIKTEYAKIIDDYFSKYGYKVNRVKIPAIKDSSKRRKYWAYTKTIECKIGCKNEGIPQEDLVAIQNIYDKGITTWFDLGEIGDYEETSSRANVIVTR